MEIDARGTPSEQNETLDLDDEIELVREEIRKLTEHRQILSASLLSSSDIQRNLSETDSSSRLAAATAAKHSVSNLHRIVYSITTFPFADPSPYTDSPDLLGVRIDISTRGGTFSNPYYVLLKHVVDDDGRLLHIYRHTIPVFINLRPLEQKYLPVPDPQYDSRDKSKSRKNRRQDLRALVRELRRELVAWHLRTDAVALLREQLGLSMADGSTPRVVQPQPSTLAQTLGISSVSVVSIDARYIRLEWLDGRVGKLRISNRGIVERAVVVGGEGRDKATESILTRGDGRLGTIVQRMSDAISL
ncbi:hypothetical protein FQN57_005068 [Myotisia sp. PD_48]|nr:hypothetical protein FQN57_005068 [Myotisia sp. PD_48]